MATQKRARNFAAAYETSLVTGRRLLGDPGSQIQTTIIFVVYRPYNEGAESLSGLITRKTDGTIQLIQQFEAPDADYVNVTF
jgi:hypothetical protein